MKIFLFGTLTLIIGYTNYSHSQVKVGDNPSTINSTALMEMESIDKGILIPRLTIAQREAISSPATGLMVFQTDSSSGFYFFNGSEWETILSDTQKVREVYKSLDIVGKGLGNTKPTTIVVGNTVGEQFQIGDELYLSISDLQDFIGGDMSVEFDFICLGTDVGSSVRWSISYLVHQANSVVNGTTNTVYSSDIALGSMQYMEHDVSLSIPEVELANAEAIHFKITRENLTSGTDPGTDPAIIHASIHYDAHR